MTHSRQADIDAVVAYSGEVWTDARGFATVSLPEPAQRLGAPVDYSLRDLEGDVTVRLKAGLEDGRFTIETDEPHVKVGWQVTGRPREEEICTRS